MKTPLVSITIVLGSVLSACNGGTVVPPQDTNRYADLPPRVSRLSGIVYDPEAFFFALATWPDLGEDPPPPALFEGIPYLTRSAMPDARVSVRDGATTADMSGSSSPTGQWEAGSVPTSDTTRYVLTATPPSGVITLGADFPSPPFTAIPSARYFPTTSLRPIVARQSHCHFQVASITGEAGGLAAVANLLTASGRPTTVADLLNPARTGGVALIWVYAPSFFLEYFTIPSDGISMTASRGTIYALEWAPPGSFPGQSPMGYAASASNTSPLGYFALVLPTGSSAPVTVTFTDTITSAPDGRPWVIPGFTAQIGSGVSIHRIFSIRGDLPPPDPTEPTPPADFGWLCAEE